MPGGQERGFVQARPQAAVNWHEFKCVLLDNFYQGGRFMPAYVVLGNFTDQGIRNIRNLRQLRDAAEGWTAAKGGRVIVTQTVPKSTDTEDVLAADVALS
jgi:hypothetical protein